MSVPRLSTFEKYLDVLLFFAKVPIRLFFKCLGLLILVFVGSLKVALVRALIHRIIIMITTKKLNIQSMDSWLIVTSLCLTINPNWLHSLSFEIVTTAHLAIAIYKSFINESNKNRRLYFAAYACILLTAPFVLSLQGSLSWLVLITAAVADPLYKVLILPLALLGGLAPSTRLTIEKILKVVFEMAHWLTKFRQPELSLSGFEERTVHKWGFIYVVFIFLVWRFSLPIYRRWRVLKNQMDPGTLF